MDDLIWYDDIISFFNSEKAFDIYPTGNMTYNEKLNSILRFSIYFSIIVYLLRLNKKVFLLPVFFSILTFILKKINNSSKSFEEKYLNDTDKSSKESNEKENDDKCVTPTENNPFMNVLISDYSNNVERNPACNIEENKIKKAIKSNFEKRLYKNLDDIDDVENSFRQFYTTSSTTIPNDQESFAKWLYFSEEKTCKEGNTVKCYK